MVGTKAKKFKIVKYVCLETNILRCREKSCENFHQIPRVLLLSKARKQDSAQQMRAKFKVGVKKANKTGKNLQYLFYDFKLN